jgi:hypothetical protein
MAGNAVKLIHALRPTTDIFTGKVNTWNQVSGKKGPTP